MKEKKIITTAKVVSIVFTPFYLPLLGMIALLVFSYLNMLPTYYKLSLLTIIYFFTVLLPTTFTIVIRAGRRCNLGNANGVSYHTSFPFCAISRAFT